MNLKPEEISSVIKEEIKKYSTEFEVANVGTVIQVADGIARIHGLEKAMQGELLGYRKDHGTCCHCTCGGRHERTRCECTGTAY